MDREKITKQHHIKSEDYFTRFRPDIIDMIPPHTGCVLSAGCASALTETELVRKNIKVYGIEIDPEAANTARMNNITVLEGNVEQINTDLIEEDFDCLIYADILEHLKAPEKTLKKHCKKLKPGGLVYISIPNFRHYTVFRDLFLRGRIDYKDAGILDRTHLRITTRKMALQWIKSCGLEITGCNYLMHWKRHKILSALTLSMAKDFIAVQIVLTARKPGAKCSL